MTGRVTTTVARQPAVTCQPPHHLNTAAGHMAHRLAARAAFTGVHAQGCLAQVDRDALGDAGRDQLAHAAHRPSRQHALTASAAA